MKIKIGNKELECKSINDYIGYNSNGESMRNLTATLMDTSISLDSLENLKEFESDISVIDDSDIIIYKDFVIKNIRKNYGNSKEIILDMYRKTVDENSIQ